MALMHSTRLVPSRASSVHPMLRLGRRRASSFFAVLRLRRRASSVVRLHNACRQAMEPLVGGAPGSVDLLGLVHRPRVRPAVVYNRAAPVHGDHGHGARSGLQSSAAAISVTCRVGSGGPRVGRRTRVGQAAAASPRRRPCGGCIGAAFGHGTRTHTLSRTLTGREASKCAVRPQSAARAEHLSRAPGEQSTTTGAPKSADSPLGSSGRVYFRSQL